MHADDGQDALWAQIVASKERLSRTHERMNVLEQFTMCDFAPEMAPKHLNRIEPGTIRW